MSTSDDEMLMQPRGMGGLAVLVIAALAFGSGLGVGGAVGWSLKAPEEKIVNVPRDLTEDELAAACAPLVQAASAQIEEINAKVTDLQTQVTTREAEVADLEAKLKQGTRLSGDQSRRLDEAKGELSSLRRQLAEAQEEKAQLAVLLAETQTKLDVQTVETERAKGDATSQRWLAFSKDAQINICEKGNRKTLGKCRETVDAKIGRMRTDFERCVRTGQEQPTLKEAAKNERLPEYAKWLDNADKITKGWYVLLCDPTLPEAGLNPPSPDAATP